MYKKFRVCLVGLAVAFALAAMGVFVAVPGTALAKKPEGGGGKPQTPCYECASGQTAWAADVTGFVSADDVVGVQIGETGPSRCLNKQDGIRFDARPDTSAMTCFTALLAVPRVETGTDSLANLSRDTRINDETGCVSNGFELRQLDGNRVEYDDGVVLETDDGEVIEHNFTMTGTGTVIPCDGAGSTSVMWFTDYELRPRGGGGGRPRNGYSASGTFSQAIKAVVTEMTCP